MSRDHVRRPHLYLPASRAVPSHPPGAMSTIVCGPTYCPSIVPALQPGQSQGGMPKGKKGEKPGFMALGGKSHMVPFVGDHSGQCTRALLLWSCPGWFRLCSLTCCAGPCLLLTIKNSIFSFFHRFHNSLFRETVSCPLQKPTVHPHLVCA